MADDFDVESLLEATYNRDTMNAKNVSILINTFIYVYFVLRINYNTFLYIFHIILNVFVVTE